jgi:hypothetical protein
MKALILSFTLLMMSTVPGFSQKAEEPGPAHSLFSIPAGREQSLSGPFKPQFLKFEQWRVTKSNFTPEEIKRMNSIEEIKRRNGLLEITISKIPTIRVQAKPYSAEETIQETWTMSDETQKSRTLQSTFVYRDSAGRTRIDWPGCYPLPIDFSKRELAPKPTVPENPNTLDLLKRMGVVVMGGAVMSEMVMMKDFPEMRDCARGRSAVPEIIDPVAGYRYYLDSLHQVAYRFSLPPSADIPQKQTQYDFLGVKTINGIEVQGIRYSTTIDKFIVPTVPTESWVSDELMIGVLRKSSFPNGEIIQTLKNIKQTEPDAALFKIPSDYKIIDGPK